MRGRSHPWDDFLQQEGKPKQTHHEHILLKGLGYDSNSISQFSKRFPCIVYFLLSSRALEVGLHIHPSFISSTSGWPELDFFPGDWRTPRKRGKLDKGAAEVVWFHRNHFISLSRDPLGLPSSIQTRLCSYGKWQQRWKTPLRNVTCLPETFKGNVASHCPTWMQGSWSFLRKLIFNLLKPSEGILEALTEFLKPNKNNSKYVIFFLKKR